MSETRAHATLGASSSKRWMNCPGSVQLSAQFPDTTSSYAIEGTLAHGLGEHVLATRLLGAEGEDSVFALVGQEISIDGVTGVVTEGMAAAVNEFVNTVEDYYRAYAADHTHTSLYLEERFDLSPLGPPAPMFGTADVVIWAEDHLHVIDYKHGQGVVVEATENSQLMYYALGAAVAAGRIPQTIAVTIVQPRAQHSDGPVRTYVFDRTRLVEFKKELFEAARLTQTSDPALNPGSWCRFCKATAVCPAQMKQAESVAMTVFADDRKPTQPPAPSVLCDEDIAKVLARGSEVMQWIRDVEAYALARMENGYEIPGYKLVRGRSNRVWIDEEKASRYLGRNGVKAEDRYTKKLVSPNAAEKLLKAKGGDTQALEKYWEKPEGAAKIAPVADSRPALPPAAQRIFGLPEELKHDSIESIEK